MLPKSNFTMPNWNLSSKIQITTPLFWAISTSTIKRNTTYNYSHKHYFSALNEMFVPQNFHQIVSFDTWSRVVNNTLRCSILDHIYVKDVTRITNLSSHTPTFGDHLLLSFEIASSKMMETEIQKRNWKTYSKGK